MASNVRPPADHSSLFSDPAEWAQIWQEIADEAWDAGDNDAFVRASEYARQFRRMVRNGEQVPEF